MEQVKCESDDDDCHSRTNEQRSKEIYKVTIIGAIGNFFLLLAKYIAGFAGNSVAMIADATHSLSDFITDIVVLVFVRISGKPIDKRYDYGYGKYETLATILIAIAVFLIGIGIAISGLKEITSFFRGELIKSPSILAFIACIVSIISKEILYRYTLVVGRRIESDMVIANAWNHRTDVFSSIGAALGIGGAIIGGAKWVFLDPVAAIIVSFVIIKASVKLLKPSLCELLEESLPDDVEYEIRNIAVSCNGVSQTENLKTRKIGNYCAIEFHVVLDENYSLRQSHAIISKIEGKIKERFGNRTHVIIYPKP